MQQGQLGVAADGGQRGAQLVRRVGGEPAQPRLAGRAPPQCGLHVAEHPVERQPHLAGLGRRVGVGHPGGQRHLARLEGQLGHLRSGGGHPAQRAEREADPEGAEHARQHEHRAEDSRLGQRHVAEHVVQAGQRHAGDVDGPVAVGVAERGEQVRAACLVQVLRVGRWVILSVGPASGVRGPPRGDALQGLQVGGRQRVLAAGNELGSPRPLPENGHERALVQALAPVGGQRAVGVRGGAHGRPAAEGWLPTAPSCTAGRQLAAWVIALVRQAGRGLQVVAEPVRQ